MGANETEGGIHVTETPGPPTADELLAEYWQLCRQVYDSRLVDAADFHHCVRLIDGQEFFGIAIPFKIAGPPPDSYAVYRWGDSPMRQTREELSARISELQRIISRNPQGGEDQ